MADVNVTAGGITLSSGYAYLTNATHYISASGYDVSGGTAAALFPAGVSWTDWGLTDTVSSDPMTGWVQAVNQGANSTSAWTRMWGAFGVPSKVTNSTGTVLSNPAAYLAVGVRFTSVGVGQSHYVDEVQVEHSPNTDWSPTTYQHPLTYTVVLTADRINLVLNPSFETDTAGWSAVGPTVPVLTRSTSNVVAGTRSMLATWSGTFNAVVDTPYDGISYTVTGLDIGSDYCVSFSVRRGAGCPPVLLLLDGVLVPTTADGYRLWAVFNAQHPTVVLSMVIDQAAKGGTTGTFTVPSFRFYIDSIMVERGGALGDYFDGDTVSGTWTSMWEATAHASRSHSYQALTERQAQAEAYLRDCTPMGCHYQILLAQPTVGVQREYGSSNYGEGPYGG